jgi:co-chaperonin GroES (HSP10)
MIVQPLFKKVKVQVHKEEESTSKLLLIKPIQQSFYKATLIAKGEKCECTIPIGTTVIINNYNIRDCLDEEQNIYLIDEEYLEGYINE